MLMMMSGFAMSFGLHIRFRSSLAAHWHGACLTPPNQWAREEESNSWWRRVFGCRLYSEGEKKKVKTTVFSLAVVVKFKSVNAIDGLNTCV